MPLPANIVPENCVLFLGSGFSAGGMNLNGTNLPVGRGLEDAIADLLKKDRGRYDLKVLGNAAQRNKSIDFYNFLYNTFTVSHLDLYQKKILSKKWQRIYTTNYDDAAEFGSIDRSTKEFNYQDAKPKQIPLGSIIHLHGSVKRAAQDNILDQIVLNKNSYIIQHIVRSPWYDELLRDIRFCDYVFFLGYSLSDPHVLALLNQSDAIKLRSYIIVRSLPDELELEDMEQYGEVLAISVSGFAQALESSIVQQQLPQFESLKSLRYANPFKDDKSVTPATPLEVRRVVMFGDVLRHRCLQILPRVQYIIPRLNQVSQSLDLLSVCQTLIVHSRLGNGKSVFAHSLAFYLIERGYHYFWIDTVAPYINRELKAIASSSIEKVVIYFDDYDTAIDLMPIVQQFLPRAKYIVSARTGVQEARASEAESKLIHPIRRQDINGLMAEDKEGLISLLSTAGISQKGMANAIRNCFDMSEIVTSVFRNAHVAAQIRQEFNNLFSHGEARNVTILSTILAYINQIAEAAFYNAVTGADAYFELIKVAEISRDFFYLENSQIQFRSSLLANYVLSDIFTAEEICRVLHSIALAAVERKSGAIGQYWVVSCNTLISSELLEIKWGVKFK